jgi:hypothetical protein
VANLRFRPDFLIRPPGGTSGDLSETLLDWDAAARSALVIDRPVGHVYVETAAGERVLDVHPAPQQELVVRVPPARPLFVRSEDASGGEYVMAADGRARVSDLTARTAGTASRGAAQLAFEDLFAVPFGTASVLDFRARWDEQRSGGLGEPAGSVPGAARPTVRLIAGVAAIGAGAVAVGLSGLAIERYATGQSASQAERARINRSLHRLELGAGVLTSVAVLGGALWLALRDHRPPGDDDISWTLLPTAGVGLALGRAW